MRIVGVAAVALLVVLVVPFISPVTVSASPVKKIQNLTGERIFIYYEEGQDPPVYEISTGDYAFVHHGWNSEGTYPGKIYWSEFTGQEKAEFKRTSKFSLFIDEKPIKLKRAKWLDHELDHMFVIYYIQFEPGDLKPGTHQFKGVWYSEVYGQPFPGTPMERTATVIVT